MKVVVDINSVLLDPANARKHNERNLEVIKASLARFGQVKPIVIDEKNIVRVGNGTLKAARSLGWKTIWVNKLDLPATEMTALALVDNRSAELAEWDNDVLASTLLDLKDLDFEISDLGFDETFLPAEVTEEDDGLAAAETGEREQVGNVFSAAEIEESAFKWYREKNGFPYPRLSLAEQMVQINKLASTSLDKLGNSVTAYQVADCYNLHRFEAAAIGMASPVDSFNKDKLLRKAIKMTLEETGSISDNGLRNKLLIVSGTQACANFRPAFARKIYETYAPKDGRVFDMSTGYGGRLVGFIASWCSEYVGTDPNVPTYKANCRLRDRLVASARKHVTLFNSPVEDLDLSEYENYFDVAFTSPPYFCKELYSDAETQSYLRYPEYESWRDGFLVSMLKQAKKVVKNDGYVVINIADVNIASKSYPLVQDTVNKGKNIGLILVDHYGMPFNTINKDGSILKEEAVLAFKKVRG